VLRRYQHVRFMNAKTTLSNRTYKYILAPIWSASYHYKDKNYQVLINGQTGEVKGRYPKSAAKIAAVVAAVLVALAAVFWYSEGGSYGAVNKAELAVNEGASTEIIITQEESQWDFLTNLPM